jgi:hypothetical protein
MVATREDQFSWKRCRSRGLAGVLRRRRVRRGVWRCFGLVDGIVGGLVLVLVLVKGVRIGVGDWIGL